MYESLSALPMNEIQTLSDSFYGHPVYKTVAISLFYFTCYTLNLIWYFANSASTYYLHRRHLSVLLVLIRSSWEFYHRFILVQGRIYYILEVISVWIQIQEFFKRILQHCDIGHSSTIWLISLQKSVNPIFMKISPYMHLWMRSPLNLASHWASTVPTRTLHMALMEGGLHSPSVIVLWFIWILI